MADKGAIDLVVSEAAFKQLDELKKDLKQIEKEIVSLSEKGLIGKDAFKGANKSSELKKALKEQRDVIASLEKAYKEMEKKQRAFIAEAEREAKAITKGNKERVKEADLIERNKKALAKQKAEVLGSVKSKGQLRRETTKLNKERVKEADRIWKNKKALDAQRKSALNAAKAQSGLTKRIGSFFKTLVAFDLARRGVQLFYDAIRNGFQALKDLESISLQFQYLVQDTREAAITQGFLANVSEELGVNLVDLSKSYLAFRKSAELANLSAEDSRIVFEEVTKAASLLGKSDAEIRNVQVALEQMLSKGTVQAEELKKQLGNVLPGSFEIMAKAVDKLNPDLDVTNAEFNKMLKAGKIIAADVLPEFSKQLTKAYGVENVDRIETMSTATIRLDNAFVSLVDNMNKGVSGFALGITTVINSMTQIINGLGLAFLDLDQIIEDRATKGYAEGVQSGIDGIAELTEEYGSLQAVIDSDIFRWNIAEEQKRIERLSTALEENKKEISELSWWTKNFSSTQGELEATQVQLNKAIAFSTGVIDEYTNAWEGANKETDKATEEEGNVHKFLEGTVGWLKEVIKFNNEKIQNSDNREVIAGIQEENKILEQQIGLLLEGSRVAKQYLNARSVGIVTELATGEKAYLDVVKDNTEALKKRQEASQDVTVIENTQKQIQLFGQLGTALQNNDFSSFATASAKSLQEFYDSIADTNPELAIYIQLLIDAEKAQKDLNDANANNEANLDAAASKTIEKLQILGMALDELTAIGSGLFDRRIQELETEMDKRQEAYDSQRALIEAEVGDEEAKQERLRQLDKQKEIDDKKIQKRIAKEKTKQAQLDKANALIQIAINTAVWATAVGRDSGLGGFVTVPIVLGIGALQAAAVLAQPIPKFKDGHLAGTHEGLALVNDGGRPEVIERKDGSLEMSSMANQLINMNKGDKVHKSFSSFANQNPDIGLDQVEGAKNLVTVKMNQQMIQGMKQNKIANDSLKGILSGEIKKGFDKVRISNDNSSVGSAVARALADDRYTNRFL